MSTSLEITMSKLRELASDAARYATESAKAAEIRPAGIVKSRAFDRGSAIEDSDRAVTGQRRSKRRLSGNASEGTRATECHANPIVTMIAGPNGSGKSTLADQLRVIGVELGQYINTHDIERELPGPPGLQRLKRARVLASRERREAMAMRTSFCFETVMHRRSKLEILEVARAKGYSAVIYFVALENSDLNVERVRQRVEMGGHAIPEELIRLRCGRFLNLLPEALAICDRAVLFDNSYRARADAPVELVPFCEVRRTAAGPFVHLSEQGRQMKLRDLSRCPLWSRPALLESLIAARGRCERP